jgi:50S ribosomal protein L16 3-hydroxylase
MSKTNPSPTIRQQRKQPQPLNAFARPRPDQPVSWLGGLTPTAFMRDYWQKKPLLVRQAFPDFIAPVSIEEVLDLAGHDLAESRLIRHSPRTQKWQLTHGPFDPNELPALTRANWTVLVQQVNTFLPKADRFLEAFRFIPEARLDDLMVSVAGPGGGVGAHVDSYDVFLVQAQGQREWQISTRQTPADLELEPDAPLKLLRQFKPQHSWVLNAGDLLYLPPNIAHKGTAVGARCMTWSVGFRAPGLPALADAVWSRHLEQLKERPWKDPELKATRSAGEIPPDLLERLTQEVLRAAPPPKAIRQAIACSLSEPAPQTVFSPPRRPLTLVQFHKKAALQGLWLHPATRLLYQAGNFFANGEILLQTKNSSVQKIFKNLSNQRQLNKDQCVAAAACAAGHVLYDMYLAGWIVYH